MPKYFQKEFGFLLPLFFASNWRKDSRACLVAHSCGLESRRLKPALHRFWITCTQSGLMGR